MLLGDSARRGGRRVDTHVSLQVPRARESSQLVGDAQSSLQVLARLADLSLYEGVYLYIYRNQNERVGWVGLSDGRSHALARSFKIAVSIAGSECLHRRTPDLSPRMRKRHCGSPW